jgi:hypothetical protein
MNNYHFYIPNYNGHSNGIKLLWEAALNFSTSRKVTVQSFAYGEKPYPLPEKYKKLIGSYNANDNPIVVYPDCVSGNPLNAKNISRYLMAKPYILNGAAVNYLKNEFVFSYSYAVNRECPQYNILCELDIQTQIPEVTSRIDKVCIYYGKIRVSESFDEVGDLLRGFNNVYVITRSFPSNKDTLYKHIQEAKLLITLDPLTNLSYESTLLGTPVYMADPVFEDSYNNYNYPLKGFFYKSNFRKKDLDNFDHDKLRNETNQILKEELSKNKEKTDFIINEMESFFSNPHSQIDCEALQKKDFDFFCKNWKFSPIYNATTKNSLISYHLMRKNLLIFLLIKLMFIGLKNIFIGLKNIFVGLKIALKNKVKNALGPSLNYFIYKLKPSRYRKRFKLTSFSEHPALDKSDGETPLIVSDKFAKFLWR